MTAAAGNALGPAWPPSESMPTASAGLGCWLARYSARACTHAASERCERGHQLRPACCALRGRPPSPCPQPLLGSAAGLPGGLRQPSGRRLVRQPVAPTKLLGATPGLIDTLLKHRDSCSVTSCVLQRACHSTGTLLHRLACGRSGRLLRRAASCRGSLDRCRRHCACMCTLPPESTLMGPSCVHSNSSSVYGSTRDVGGQASSWHRQPLVVCVVLNTDRQRLSVFSQAASQAAGVACSRAGAAAHAKSSRQGAQLVHASLGEQAGCSCADR